MIMLIEGVIMGMRMDKYKNETEVPTRSNKNQELYKQIYNAYDEFENLVVPSNSREITMSDLKKEISSREEYHDKKDYVDILNKKTDDDAVKKKKKYKQDEEQVYDIKELLSKAVSEKDNTVDSTIPLSNGDYLKKIKLDSKKTNIEQVKEIYDNVLDDEINDDESLLKTANLSLEILSDLKSDNDKTVIEAPIKDSELPKDVSDNDFYSSKYKFNKKDFEGKDSYIEEETEDEEDDDFREEHGGYKKFFKVMLLVFGILLVIILLFYIFNFFNRV